LKQTLAVQPRRSTVLASPLPEFSEALQTFDCIPD
jgi:hypothetical protein